MLRHWIGFALIFFAISSARAQPAQVMIIRHAEKPETGNELSLAGEERAAALVPYFRRTAELLEFDAPVAIYAQAANDETPSLRPMQTVQPLADALKVTVNHSFAHDEFLDMVKEIMECDAYRGRTVLICWEHKVIPQIATAFGATDVPNKWHGQAFDRTWLIHFKPGKAPHLRDLPQKLMYKDSDE